MNAVGKMLVVLQLCLSLLFVCFAGAAYSTQGNWKTAADQANAKVKDLQASSQSSLAEHEREIQEANAARLEAERQRDEFRARIAGAEDRANTAEGLLADSRAATDRAVAETQLANEEARARQAEATAARVQISSLSDALAGHLDDIRERDNENSELVQQLREYRSAEERNLAELTRLSEILRFNKIDPNSVIVGEVPQLAEKVDGRVFDRLENQERTREYVSVNIGSNDGIKKNMILRVYRTDSYVCDVEVITVEADQSVAVVVERSRRSTAVKVNDYVTTKF